MYNSWLGCDWLFWWWRQGIIIVGSERTCHGLSASIQVQHQSSSPHLILCGVYVILSLVLLLLGDNNKTMKTTKNWLEDKRYTKNTFDLGYSSSARSEIYLWNGHYYLGPRRDTSWTNTFLLLSANPRKRSLPLLFFLRFSWCSLDAMETVDTTPG